jgi:hypothetical protein
MCLEGKKHLLDEDFVFFLCMCFHFHTNKKEGQRIFSTSYISTPSPPFFTLAKGKTKKKEISIWTCVFFVCLFVCLFV